MAKIKGICFPDSKITEKQNILHQGTIQHTVEALELQIIAVETPPKF
jgi:hypothetical protein